MVLVVLIMEEIRVIICNLHKEIQIKSRYTPISHQSLLRERFLAKSNPQEGRVTKRKSLQLTGIK